MSKDEAAVFQHCRTTPGLISDAAARVIASWWADGPLGQSFATTGAVTAGVWAELSTDGSGSILRRVSPDHRQALERLHAYLGAHAGRGPVADWARLWIR